MKPPFLANDICRCHDEQCAIRQQCLRWILRTTGGPRTPHADTLHDGEEPTCGHFIEDDTD
jgi:hypothetical protein